MTKLTDAIQRSKKHILSAAEQHAESTNNAGCVEFRNAAGRTCGGSGRRSEYPGRPQPDYNGD